MAIESRRFFSCCDLLLLLCCFQVLLLASAVESKQLATSSSIFSTTPTRDLEGDLLLVKCQHCTGRKIQIRELEHSAENSVGQASSNQENKNIDITTVYTDPFGIVKTHTVKSKDLSPFWVIEKYDGEDGRGKNSYPEDESLHRQPISVLDDYHQSSIGQRHHYAEADLMKLERRKLREERRQSRAEELIQTNEDAELKMQLEAIERSNRFDLTGGGKYNTWRREFQNPSADNLLKYMRDQIILAKVYASIARPHKKVRGIYNMLKRDIKQCAVAVGEADSDGELQKGALAQATALGNSLSKAKAVLHNCEMVARKLRAMVQAAEEITTKERRKSLFLMEFVSFSIPKALHCLSLELTNEYFLHHHFGAKSPNDRKIDDPSLFHFAIFSDNVLSTWVVVNSTVMNAKEPERHVFHIVTDRLQFPAMKMWFISHPPSPATVQVESFDQFKWLNSSYCPVLRQLESENMKEFYYKANHPSTLSAVDERLKYKNPKYLSMLNHIRFYLPELFPKLDKVLFLDDDVVVQKDLTLLWSIDMKGMVNGAVQTCKLFDTYLNFSNPEISKHFNPKACGWAFGMNLFDLKQWRKRNLTEVYHYWQNLNKDRTLWSLGTLPPGLMTFYNLTYVLDQSWHVLALGYRPGTNISLINNASVIHYNGNNKPWLDVGYAQFKGFWSKYVHYDDKYIRTCHVNIWG